MNYITARIRTFNKFSYLLMTLVKKDFTTKYRRSVLGVLWSVLNPLMMMFVIATVFSQVFKIQIDNYAAYYLTGTLIFSFMSEATNGSLTSILGAAGLIRKVYIPKYLFPAEKCLFAGVNTFFTLIAAIIILPFIGITLKWTVFLIIPLLLYVLFFSYGLGLILSAVNVFFNDIGHLYGVFTQIWMYLTPILYPVDILPDNVKLYVWYNPMYYYVEYCRDVLMYGIVPDLQFNLICAAFSISFLILGLVVFKTRQDKFILYI